MSTSAITAAAVQCDPQVGLENKDKNLARTLELVTEAADRGANLVVLPELVNTGYSFATREEAYAHAEELTGPTVQAWTELARSRGIHLVGGITELDGVRLFDTAVLIGPDGLIGHYRKTHLWHREKLVFTPGDLGFPVFETRIGRIGLLICWDIWFPEVARLLAVQGADVICSVNNWVWTPPPLFDDAGRCMAAYLTMTASHVNGVPIVAANRVGEERAAKFLGCSLITGTNGWPASEVAAPEGDTIVYSGLDLMATRSAAIWNELNDLPRDRRTDLYDPLLGYRGGQAYPR
ncbi:nitrilase family protein [Amycolatopsis tucumanensis]|uniref:Nitrilase family protein n=1 Tax=Amycolatopsis tucumanensis TaxID=401106 RepID=A0ABP7IGD1_9PSEU|nr:nitrilase family protein [Amycolatopsis tucumanensis]MCF6427744.1 nitrilase family protein [Amycolatopsis tucumanensis]